MTPQEIKDELERTELIRQALKREAMVYQAGAKRECATFLGMAETELFDLPCYQWQAVASYARSYGWIG